MNSKEDMKRLYYESVDKPKGSEIQCCVCNAEIIKHTYNHVFCTLGCKKKYSNSFQTRADREKKELQVESFRW